MNKKEIKAEVEKGKIHCRIMLQVAGTPKEHVEGSLKGYIATIDSDEAYTVIESDVHPAEKEGDFFSSFADIELLARDAGAITTLCFNYMPSSVELIDPKEISYKRKDLDAWFNDLLAKLHEISMLSKEVGAQNKTMINNMNVLIKNAALMGIRHGKEIEEIAASLGMREQDLEPFIKALIKEGKIKAEKKTETKVSESSPKPKKATKKETKKKSGKKK